MKDVAVIIPHYNADEKYIKLCVESLKQQTYKPKIVVVSSGPKAPDISVDIHHISATRLHYAQAINKGVTLAQATYPDLGYIVLGNDDTVYSRLALEGLIQVANNNDIIVNALSNCDIDYLYQAFFSTSDGTVLKPGMAYEEISAQALEDIYACPLGQFLFVRTSKLAFYATLIPIKTWNKIGTLDESFVTAGWEDEDYCRRAHQQNIPTGFTTRSFIFHFGGVTSSKETTEEERRSNIEKFQKKWGMLNS